MSIQIFYHIACLGTWEEIVKSQLSRIIFSGLYDKVDVVNCYVLGCGDGVAFERCIRILNSYGKKIVIRKSEKTAKFMECFTLSDIVNHIQPGTKFLYIHTKGVTRRNSNLYNNGTVTINIPDLYDHIMDWNDVMEYFLIKNHEECLKELDDHDVVGINYLPYPTKEAGHFSGNFWWCTGRYFLTLKPIPEESIYGETMVCANKPNFKNLFSTCLADGYGHYKYGYKPINYVDKKN